MHSKRKVSFNNSVFRIQVQIGDINRVSVDSEPHQRTLHLSDE